MGIDAFSTPRFLFNMEGGADFPSVVAVGSELIPSSELGSFLVNVLINFGWNKVRQRNGWVRVKHTAVRAFARPTVVDIDLSACTMGRAYGLIPLGILLVLCFRLDFEGLDIGGESDLIGLLILASEALSAIDFESGFDWEGPAPEAIIGKGSGRGFDIMEAEDDPAILDFELKPFIAEPAYKSLFLKLEIEPAVRCFTGEVLPNLSPGRGAYA